MVGSTRHREVNPMMYWDHMSGWGWAWMGAGSIVFWALLIAGIVALIRYTRTTGTDRESGRFSRPTPEQLLAERYARGEIDETEYRQRLDTLTAAGAGGRSTR
jgi:putative membrane protein